MRMLPVILSAWFVVGLWGCADARREAEAGLAVARVEKYAEGFAAARQVLRDEGFILERVDSRAEGGGVITTRPKTTAGLATPWDREQSTFGQDLEDLFQRQQRVVRVEFASSAGGAELTSESPANVSVHVVIQRVQVPGHKLEPEAVWQHSYYVDPELGDRMMQPSYAVAWKEDRLLAERLAKEIGRASAGETMWQLGTPRSGGTEQR
jgi:hypothetical protein